MDEREVFLTIFGEIKEKRKDERKVYLKISMDGDIIEARLVAPDSEYEALLVGEQRSFYLILRDEEFVVLLSKEARNFVTSTKKGISGVGFFLIGCLLDLADKKNMSIDDILFEIAMGNTQFFEAIMGKNEAKRYVEGNRNRVNIQSLSRKPQISSTQVENEDNPLVDEAREMLQSLGFMQTDINAMFSHMDLKSFSNSSELIQKAIALLKS